VNTGQSIDGRSPEEREGGVQYSLPERYIPTPIPKGDPMATSGSKDKGNKEQKKKPKHNLKEKRKLKQEKKQKHPFMPGG
jgi:hypothetical protein